MESMMTANDVAILSSLQKKTISCIDVIVSKCVEKCTLMMYLNDGIAVFHIFSIRFLMHFLLS